MSPRADDLARLGRALGDRVAVGRPLGALTTYRVGGPAALTLEPADEDELVDLARRLEGLDVPVLVLGRGSNLLVADRGFDGLVVSLGAAFESITVEGRHVRAGAAVALPVLARRTVSAGLSGLEWAVGVPGSVGGAVRMNAGGHGSDTAATLLACRQVELATGSVHETPAASLGLAYRQSRIAPTDVVVSATFGLEPGAPEAGRAAIDGIVRWRRANQPGGSNAGSVFSNPPGDSAGRLIEACGLKGFRLGSAEVSTRHANFFQADPGGSADDVRRLMAHVQAEVVAARGVVLHPEVRLVGFDDSEGTSR
jgi:UDP-N-acetylmuramate dehydrogenase